MLRLKLISAAVVPVLVAGARALHVGADATPAPAAAMVAAAPVSTHAVTPSTSTAADDRLPARGIDVSHFQGRVDWSAVEGDGVGFAFVKATEGSTFVDPAFRRNWSALGETRILRGAYHRFRTGRHARAQPEHFLAVFRISGADLPPVLDVEATDGLSDARLVRG